MRMIFVGVNSEMRRTHLNEWIQFYIKEFKAECEKRQINYENTVVGKNSHLFDEIFNKQKNFEIFFTLIILSSWFDNEKCEETKSKYEQRCVDLFIDYLPEFERYSIN